MPNTFITKATAALQESVASIIGCDDDDATKRFALAESFSQFEDYIMKHNGGADVVKARARGAGGHRSLTGALIEHLHDRLERRREQHGYQKREEGPLDQHQELISIMKDCGGPVALCKGIVDRGRSPCGEHELVTALTKAASEQHPEKSPSQAFAELYKTESVWRACAIAKAMPFVADLTPLVVGGEDTRDLSDQSEAIAHLKQLGARKWPTASEVQQFANAFTDPVNRELASRAHVRPVAPAGGIYPYPR